jgi:hypothetical protein
LFCLTNQFLSTEKEYPTLSSAQEERVDGFHLSQIILIWKKNTL